MADPIEANRLIRFGVFEVNLATRELGKSGVRIKLVLPRFGDQF